MNGPPPALMGRNSLRPVSPSDAPKAARSRLLRRAWAAEVNRIIRRTGDPDAALRVGAGLIMAAIDCDAATAAHVAKAGGRTAPPLTLPMAARHRQENDDDAGERVVEAILKDEIPGFNHPERNPEQGSR
jgi:hypothetical protein